MPTFAGVHNGTRPLYWGGGLIHFSGLLTPAPHYKRMQDKQPSGIGIALIHNKAPDLAALTTIYYNAVCVWAASILYKEVAGLPYWGRVWWCNAYRDGVKSAPLSALERPRKEGNLPYTFVVCTESSTSPALVCVPIFSILLNCLKMYGEHYWFYTFAWSHVTRRRGRTDALVYVLVPVTIAGKHWK